jgi:hypothetical protein
MRFPKDYQKIQAYINNKSVHDIVEFAYTFKKILQLTRHSLEISLLKKAKRPEYIAAVVTKVW